MQFLRSALLGSCICDRPVHLILHFGLLYNVNEGFTVK